MGRGQWQTFLARRNTNTPTRVKRTSRGVLARNATCEELVHTGVLYGSLWASFGSMTRGVG